jgi:hypothetical protein
MKPKIAFFKIINKTDKPPDWEMRKMKIQLLKRSEMVSTTMHSTNTLQKHKHMISKHLRRCWTSAEGSQIKTMVYHYTVLQLQHSCLEFLDFITLHWNFFNFLFIYSHVHTLFEPFLPPALHPFPLSPIHPPCFQAEPVLPLSLILLKRRHKQ